MRDEWGCHRRWQICVQYMWMYNTLRIPWQAGSLFVPVISISFHLWLLMAYAATEGCPMAAAHGLSSLWKQKWDTKLSDVLRFLFFFFFLPWLLSHKEEKLKKMQVGVFVALTTEPPLNTNNSHPKLKIQNPSTQYILLRESRQNHLKIICDTLNSHWLNYIFLRHRTFSLSDCLISH